MGAGAASGRRLRRARRALLSRRGHYRLARGRVEDALRAPLRGRAASGPSSHADPGVSRHPAGARVFQIGLFCAPQLMSAERPLRAQIGGLACVLPERSLSRPRRTT